MLEAPAESFRLLGAHTRHIHAHDGLIVAGKVQVSEVLGAGVFDHA